MKLRFILCMLLIPIILMSGCRKSKPAEDPCEGLIGEMAPVTIILQFTEKQSGDNLILSKGLKPEDITVTDKETGKTVDHWRLITQGNSATPLNGFIVFAVFNEIPGTHPYEIRLKTYATATLMYTVSRVSTNNPCKPVAFPVSDIKVTDHPYKPLVIDGKSDPHILSVELD